MKPTWRQAEARDWPAIQESHRQLEESLGKKMDLPDLHDPAIMGWFVAEKDGVVIGSFYLERCVEVCFTGIDPIVTGSVKDIAGDVVHASRNAGIRFMHCLVPKNRQIMGEDLRYKLDKTFERCGFEYVGDNYSIFVNDLR